MAHEPNDEGAWSLEAIRARIVCFGNERRIPIAEIERVLSADLRCPDDVLLQFLEDHDISADWLFMGDLRGLRRMRWPSSHWDYVS